jgi:hypothetical protein
MVSAQPLHFGVVGRVPPARAQRLEEDTEAVLTELLGVPSSEYARLHDADVVASFERRWKVAIVMDAMAEQARLLDLCGLGLASAEQLLVQAHHGVVGLISRDGRVHPALLDTNQIAAHGFACQATYVEALRRTLLWARALHATGAFTETEAAILRLDVA